MVDTLLVLWGESYRFGSQMTRKRGCGDYFNSSICIIIAKNLK